MNIQGGGISFEVSGTNEKLMRVLEQSKRAISTFSREGVTAGRDVDAGFEQAAQAIQTAFQKVDAVIDENLQAIKELQAQNEKLKAQYAKAFMSGDDKTANSLKAQVQENERIIRARQQIIDQAQPIIAELNEEDKKLQEQRKHTEDNVTATKSLKAQLRECREQLALMEERGQRNTEAYRKMQQEAGRLTDALGDAQTQAKILSHDNQLLQGTMSLVSGIAGGFTAAQGAVALFAGENENLQRVMLKVQSLMSITMGLQQVMNTLNKDSAFQLTIVARAKDMLTAANARLATALGISTAAAQALMATLTLGLSAAITAIVVLISRMSSENTKAAEQQKKFNEEVAKAAGKPLSAYVALKTEWENLTGSMKEREKWVQDNADRFAALGLKVYDAKTAEDVLIRNSENFVKACIAKAKALAAQNLAAEKYEEILKKQAEVEAMPDKETKYIAGGSAVGIVTTYETENSAKKKAKEELEELKKQAKAFIEQQMQFTQEEQQLLAGLGDASAKVIAGSVEAVEAEISRLQQLYKRAATDAERADLAKQIAAEQAKLSKIQLKTNTSTSGTPKDPYLDMLQKRKTAYAQYSKWVQSEDATVREAASREFAAILKEGTSYLDYLEKQRAAISGKAKKTAADLHKLTVLNNEIAETTKQTVLSDFEAQINRELQMCNTIGQRLSVLAKQRESLANDNSDVDREKRDILREAEESTMQQARQETAALLQEYAAYTNERIKFEESYARNRELLLRTIHAKEIDGEDAFIAELLKAKAAYAAYAKEITSDDATVAASAKQRYAELLREGSTFTEMLRNRIRQIEDRQVKVGVEVSGIKQLAALRAELRAIEDEKALVELRAQIRALEDKQVTIGLDVEGAKQLDSLREQLAQVEDRRVKIGFDVEDDRKLQALRTQIRQLEGKLVTVGLDVEGTDQLNQLRQQVRAIEDREFSVIVDVAGTNRLKDLRAQINALEGKIVNVGLEVADAKQLTSLRQQIGQLEGKQVTVGLNVTEQKQLLTLRQQLRDLEDKQVTVGLNVEGAKQLTALRAELRKIEDEKALINLRNQVRELEDREITIGLDVEGTEQLKELRQQIGQLEDRLVKVGLEVEGEAQLTALRTRIRQLEGKRVTVGLDVEGTRELTDLRRQVRAIEDRQVQVTIDVQRAERLQALNQQVRGLEDRLINIGLDVQDTKQLQALRAQIRQLEDKRVKVGLDVEGQALLNQLKASLRALEDKQISVALDVEGMEQLKKLRLLLESENTTDAQVQAAIAALAALEKKAKEFAKQSGSAMYDELLQQYRSYQQQQSDIQQRYAEQRMEAEKHGNTAMIAEINAKEQAELSKLAASRLMASESWNQLFSDLTTLSAKTINKLMADINRQKVTLSAQFNPADLKAINDQLEKAKNELHKRNPFIALRDSLAELRESMKADKLLSSDDPFVKQLQEKKKQYEDYAQAVNSRDEILARASKAAFSELLKDGSSYIDYINGKIAQLENKRLTIGLTIDEENALGQLQQELGKAQTDAVAFAEGLNRRIAELQQKKVTIGLDVEEGDALERLQQELASIGDLGTVTGDKWKAAFADLLQEGSSFVEMLKRKIAKLQQKKVTIGLDVQGEEQLAALQAILKKVQGETKNVGTALKETFSSVSSSIEFIGGAFDSVVGGMKKMGIAMDEETEHILGDISGMISGAGQLASGIATGNPLSIIQGSVGFLSSAFDLFNSRDRKAERSIKEHEKAVTRLGRAYNQLKHEVDKALGESVYKNQNSMIANLRAQQVQLNAMIADEKSKKKTDWDRIEEWQEQIDEAKRQIEDIIADITKSITQTTAGDLASKLADALTEAFEAGEDAADAFGKVANEVLRNAVKNALKLQFLEKPLRAAIKQLQKDMGFDEEGRGTFDGLSAAEQARFKDSVAKAGANFNQAMQMYKDLFNQLDESDPSTLSGAIKGASQESIDLLAGQANAVRVNQVTSLDLLRQQLTRLSTIDTNVGVIAGRLLTIIQRLTTPADDGLRGQGITG